MKDLLFTVKSNTVAAAGVFRLELAADEPLPFVRPGQFLNLEVPDKSLILRRPFCIYDSDDFCVTIFFAVVGKGTQSLSGVKKGDKLKAILPLGNGFDVSPYKNIALLGGGIGCAELFSITRESANGKSFYAYLGFSNKSRVMFENDFNKRCKKLTVCTYDGSYGVAGYPLSELQKDISMLDAVLICGSPSLVKSAQKELGGLDIPVLVSTEQRMGCGVGACLVCTCAVNENGIVKNKRVCADGPIFNLKDLVL